MARVLSKTYSCPTAFTLSVLGGKWKTVVLSYLKERPLRYGELRRLTPGLSDKMLSERLKELEEDGLIARQVVEASDAVMTYALTARGQSLGPALCALYAWGQAHAEEYGVKCEAAADLTLASDAGRARC